VDVPRRYFDPCDLSHRNINPHQDDGIPAIGSLDESLDDVSSARARPVGSEEEFVLPAVEVIGNMMTTRLVDRLDGEIRRIGSTKGVAATLE
jgi:hypothetical protein